MNDRELLFGIMATLGRKEYSVRSLFALVKPFDISETNLRSILSRMRSDGLVDSRRDGRYVHYSFSAKSQRLSRNVSFGFESRDWSTWDDRWWGVVFSVPDLRKNDRYRIRKKLKAYRFAPLYPGFWIRPAHETEDVLRPFNEIEKNRTGKILKTSFSTQPRIDEIDAMWHISAINRELKEALVELRTYMAAISGEKPDEIFRLKMLVGGKMVSALFKDPILPDQFLPNDWKADELRTLFVDWDTEATNLSRPFWESALLD